MEMGTIRIEALQNYVLHRSCILALKALAAVLAEFRVCLRRLEGVDRTANPC